MKTLSPIFAFLYFLVGNIFSGQFYAQNTKSEPGFMLYFTMGRSEMTVEAADISFGYRDESPYSDYLSRNLVVKPSTQAYTLNFGTTFHFKKLKPLWFSFGYGVNFNKSTSTAIGEAKLGIDLVPAPKLQIMPYAAFNGGNTSIYLGRMTNDNEYIQVNDQKFYADSVEISLKSHFRALKYGLQISYLVHPKIRIVASGSYSNQIQEYNNVISFSGLDINKTEVSAAESVTASNVFLSINNGTRSPQKSLATIGGLAFEGGIAFGF